jgi:hypothetical protein
MFTFFLFCFYPNTDHRKSIFSLFCFCCFFDCRGFQIIIIIMSWTVSNQWAAISHTMCVDSKQNRQWGSVVGIICCCVRTYVCWKCLYNNNGITHRSLICVCVCGNAQHRYINTQQHPTTPPRSVYSSTPLDYPLPIFVSTFSKKCFFFFSFSFSCFNDPCFLLLLLSALLFSLHCTRL